jgi:hypothetical protein
MSEPSRASAAAAQAAARAAAAAQAEPRSHPWRQRVAERQARVTALQRQRAGAVLADADQQAECAATAQALGVRRSAARALIRIEATGGAARTAGSLDDDSGGSWMIAMQEAAKRGWSDHWMRQSSQVNPWESVEGLPPPGLVE